MNWLNLRTEILHSPEFIGCHPTRRATWLSLSLWCASQENGGVVIGGRHWSDRQWQQTCGVTKDEATDSCSLFALTDDDVVLWGYPAEKEAEVQERRELARHNGRKGGRPLKKRSKKPTPEPTLVSENNQHRNQHGNQRPKAEGEGEGEGEGESIMPTPPAAPFVLALEIPPQPIQAEAIYAAYPRKIAKADALKAIARTLKAGAVTAADLLSKVQAYAAATAQWPADERQYIPYPASWINAGQFNDDPSNWTRNTKTNATATSRRSFSDSNDYSAVKF